MRVPPRRTGHRGAVGGCGTISAVNATPIVTWRFSNQGVVGYDYYLRVKWNDGCGSAVWNKSSHGVQVQSAHLVATTGRHVATEGHGSTQKHQATSPWWVYRCRIRLGNGVV